MIQLTRTAALEYAATGIRVNAVCPGAIYTPMLAAATIARLLPVPLQHIGNGCQQPRHARDRVLPPRSPARLGSTTVHLRA